MLKKTSFFVLCSVLSFSPIFSQNNLIRIEIEVCIDGKSLLCLQDNKLWWVHLTYYPPGTHADCQTGISVNGQTWGSRHWEKPFELNFSLDMDSLLYVEKLSPYNGCIKIRPSKENKWRTVIELDDEKTNGPHTYKLILVFKTSSRRHQEQTLSLTGHETDLFTDCTEESKPVKVLIQPAKKEDLKTEDPKIEKDQPFIFKNVYFESNKSILLPESFTELDKVVNVLVKKDNTFVISGHTDNSGDPAKNLKLSEERAKAVYDYFLKKGIEIKRMHYVGQGDKFPIDSNTTEEGKRKNRRVELKIVE